MGAVTFYGSIAPAIEQEVIESLHDHITRYIQHEGKAPANWMTQLVASESLHKDPSTPVTVGYVSGVMWELIDSGTLDIDKFGMIRIVVPLPDRPPKFVFVRTTVVAQ